jgi:DNA-binding NarL/FixJ family response regulator
MKMAASPVCGIASRAPGGGSVFQQPSSGEAAHARLSRREKEIIALLGKGYLYKGIADQLGLSVETVRTGIHNIYEKLHVHARTEAVMKVYDRLVPG